MIEIVGSLNLAELEDFYRECRRRFHTYASGNWVNPYIIEGVHRLCKPFFRPGEKYTWVGWWDADMLSIDNAHNLNWHTDRYEGQVNDLTHLTLAYPTATEFLIDGEIIRPKVGELVRASLSQVQHRTPEYAIGCARLLIRYAVESNTA